MAIILRPVKYSQCIFYAPHPQFDVSLSGGPLGETRGHVSNIALSEANAIVECLQSSFIADAVSVSLCAEPDPFEGLVNWVPRKLDT